jgi:hypothetical protein
MCCKGGDGPIQDFFANSYCIGMEMIGSMIIRANLTRLSPMGADDRVARSSHHQAVCQADGHPVNFDNIAETVIRGASGWKRRL